MVKEIRLLLLGIRLKCMIIFFMLVKPIFDRLFIPRFKLRGIAYTEICFDIEILIPESNGKSHLIERKLDIEQDWDGRDSYSRK